MTDQGLQYLDNDFIIHTDPLSLSGLPGGNTLLASLQLALPNGRIDMQVQINTRYPLSSDLLLAHRGGGAPACRRQARVKGENLPYCSFPPHGLSI